jgi:hypothetical protein
MRKFIFIAVLGLISSQGCTCLDDPEPWTFEERLDDPDAAGDAAIDADVGEDASDMEVEPPIPGPSDETVVEGVPREFAGRERTSLAVDDRGTVWLGYHRCIDDFCDRTMLTLANRRRGESWRYEDIQEQRGTFGVDVAVNGRPVAAYLSPLDNTFKVARRTAGVEKFEVRTLGVRRTGPSDGLDLARDGDRIFVTFANQQDPVSTFVLEDGAWSVVDSLDVRDASAAYERGLRADGDGNLFLVHQGGTGQPFGIAQFSLERDEWIDRTYYADSTLRPSSLVVTRDKRLCMAGHVADFSGNPYGFIGFSCGDMSDLAQEFQTFRGEPTTDYSSMLEGNDGTLYVAFNDASRAALRLGRRFTDGTWQFEDIYDGTTFGVSTVIDKDDLLIISFYDCDGPRCDLKVITRPQ